MTQLRKKILNFFDNISKKDYKMKEMKPELYNKFQELTKNYPNSRYSRKIYNIRNKHHYILYRLSDKGKIKLFANYCKTNKIPMSEPILSYYKVNLSMVEFYTLMHGDYPKCTQCNINLSSLKVQLYTTLDENKNRFCSKACQKQSHIDKVKNTLKDNGSELIEYNINNFSTIRCPECNKTFTRNTSNIFTKNMFKCNPCLSKYSRGQFEIYNILKEFDKDIKLEVRDILPGKIIDIYSEKYKIAIEFDGLMYHSYGVSKHSVYNNISINKNIHYERTYELNKLGIRLFRVWDIEWLNEDTKNKWINILKNAFKQSNSKIYARNCKIQEIKSKEARVFMDKNHMQGFAPAKLYYGLYYEEELVSIMTFGKSIRSKGEWELLRFCSKNNCNIVGAASKLLRHFEMNHDPRVLISYANLRWSEGNIYEVLGFKFNKIVAPSYHYFMNNYDRTLKIFHRTKFTRRNIEKYYNNNTYEIKHFDEKLTELENMFKNNYRIIYDCGMKKYIKTYSTLY